MAAAAELASDRFCSIARKEAPYFILVCLKITFFSWSKTEFSSSFGRPLLRLMPLPSSLLLNLGQRSPNKTGSSSRSMGHSAAPRSRQTNLLTCAAESSFVGRDNFRNKPIQLRNEPQHANGKLQGKKEICLHLYKFCSL